MKDLVCGGYLLVRQTPKGENMHLIPKEIRSASECMCYQFPHPGLIDWAKGEDMQDYLNRMAIPAEKVKDAETWCSDNFGESFGWQNVFYTLKAAREAKDLFFKNDPAVSILGLGLPREYVQPFIEFSNATLQRPGEKEASGKSATLEMLEKGETLFGGDKLLGYELLSTEEIGLIYHSHMCQGWENAFDLHLGIKPNKNGFYNDLETAKKCLQFLNDEHDPEQEEMDYWSPWAIFEYS